MVVEQDRPDRKQVSLTPFAYSRLVLLLGLCEKAVSERPQDFPGYADRRLTFSDTINILWQERQS